MRDKSSGQGKHRARQYSPDERAEAVRIVRASKGRSVRSVAFDLGIPAPTLHRWVATAREIELDPAGTMTDAARKRLRQLEEENARLRKDLEYEKKARAFIQEISRRRNDSR
jgi:transposase-like protein